MKKTQDAEEPGTKKTTAGAQPAVIRRLLIERYRGIKKLDWWPDPGLNVILGAGDVRKTTILDAIALLLSPSNAIVITDTDFWCRNLEADFSIRAIISLPLDSGINTQPTMVGPWDWNGKTAVAPTLPEDGAPSPALQSPVYKVMVRGTPELDLTYEIVQPHGISISFSPNLRRAIGVVRLGGDDRNDRDLRLVQGSSLDRLLADKTLRSRLGVEFSKDDVTGELQEDGQTALKALDESLSNQSLPHALGLGLNLGQGQSVSALIGLTSNSLGFRLPLTNWGAGTRRLTSLAVAQSCRTGSPITLIDEAERGLEPYRQRALVSTLAQGAAQVFMTTHSGTVLSAAQPSVVWHLNSNGNIGKLDPEKTAKHRQRDPEAYLARLAIICEGATEVGFASHLLRTKLDDDLAGRGIRLSDGGGHEICLQLLRELSSAGFVFGGFADNEGKGEKMWATLKGSMGDLLMQWPEGCTESQVIQNVPEDKLEILVEDPEHDLTQPRINTLIDRIRRGQPDVSFEKHSFNAVKEQAGISHHSFEKMAKYWFWLSSLFSAAQSCE